MSLYIGLISGTSMDAVDAALVSHAAHPPEVVATHAHPIPDHLGEKLLAAVTEGAPVSKDLWQLDVRVGALFADAALELLERAGVSAADVVAIGSHGQTIYHGPKDDPPVTIQIGDPNVIAERTGITTVADFRRRDLAAGGQGAPLVPAFHLAVFRSSGTARAVVNIGGIANVTVLPGDPEIPALGFDTGPGNTLMDTWCQRHRGAAMDSNGEWAGGGTVLPALLDVLLADPYFEQKPPKSTGREYFHLRWLDAALSRAGYDDPDPRDVQRTLCELTAATIARDVRKHASGTQQILVCGGGAANPVLMGSLARHAGDIAVSSTAALGFDPGWIEAVAFSWFAKKTLERQPSNVPSVTGARHSVVLGGIYYA